MIRMNASLAWLLWKNELPIESVLSFLYKSGVNIMDSLEEVELSGSGEEMMNLYEELTAVVNGKVEVYQ